MAEWSFLVPPDLIVALRAKRKPRLLSRALGGESARGASATVILDLDAAIPASGVRGRYKNVPWRFQVTLDGGRRTIAFRSPLFSEYLALHIALLPQLRRALQDRGVALIPGAACASGGVGAVFAGGTGAGKTAVLLAAAVRGQRLIGDEYVGVSAAGDVTPVLRVVALRRRTLADAPELSRRLGAMRRTELVLAQAASRLSLGQLDPLVHVSPHELGLDVASEGAARVATLWWLERSASAEPVPMTARDAVDALLSVQQAHDRAYGSGDDIDTPRWRDTLARGLRQVRCLRASASLPADALARLASAAVRAAPSPP